MKNQDVLYLAMALKDVDAPEMEPGFNYAISATLADANKVAETIKKALAPTEEYSKYEEELQALREKFAEKDENGDPKFFSNNGVKQYVIKDIGKPGNPFSKAVEKLQEKNKEVIDKREKQLEFIFEENKDFKPHTVSVAQIPKGLSRASMDAVYLIVEEKE